MGCRSAKELVETADVSPKVECLSAEEAAAVAFKYNDSESIFSALEGDSTVLLRASWLRAQRGSLLPKRPLPPEAYISAAELRQIYSTGCAAHSDESDRARYGFEKVKPLPVIAISYYWRSPQHPDPESITAGLIIDALEGQWQVFSEFFGDNFDLGIFLDWSSLFQEPRTSEQLVVFKKSLLSINLWYAHRLTTVWMVTEGSVSCKKTSRDLTYWDKGWTMFEYQLLMMIKTSNASKFSRWPQICDISKPNHPCVKTHEGWHRLSPQSDIRRWPACEPFAFFEGGEYGAQVYTNGADRDQIVAPKFRDTVREVLGSTESLLFDGLHWGDKGCMKLALVLPLYTRATHLELFSNDIGEAGASALGNCLSNKALPCLKILACPFNEIGDVGAKALADAILRGAMPALNGVNLTGNEIGDIGAVAFCSAFAERTTSVGIGLSSNQITDVGAKSLIDRLSNGAMQPVNKLCLGGCDFRPSNPISDEVKERLKLVAVERSIEMELHPGVSRRLF